MRSRRQSKEARGELDEQAEIAVLKRERKRRAEAAEAYRDGRPRGAGGGGGGRGGPDRRLPAGADLRRGARARSSSEAVEETGASPPKEIGKVMAAVMPKVGGRADGKRVSELVREKLAG